MHALLRKEFRESVRWLPLGWLLMGGMLWAKLPGLDQIEFVPSLIYALTAIFTMGSVFALGLSIAQFAPDQRNSARAFLIHRGLSRTQIFHGKLIIGIAMYALAIWLPMLIGTLYLEWIGPLRLPTSARQTIPAWVISVYAFSFYFGGGMVVCSNARWVGTRMLPLVFSCLVTFCGLAATLSAPTGLVLLILAFAACGIYSLYRASQDAFENGAHRVAPGIGVRSVWSRNLVLTLASIVASITALLFPSNFISQSNVYRYVVTGVDDAGDAWYVLHEGGYIKARSRISSDSNAQVIEKTSDALETADHPMRSMILRPVTSNPPTNWFSGNGTAALWSPEILSSGSSGFLVFDQPGYILAYKPVLASQDDGKPHWLLSHVISQDRVSRTFEPRGKPFTEKPAVISPNLLVSADGLRWFDKDTGQVNHFAKMQVDGYAERTSMGKHSLFVYSGQKLLQYPNVYDLVSPETIQPEATFNVGGDLTALGPFCQFWYKDTDNFTLTKSTLLGSIVVVQRPDKDLERFTSRPPKGMQNSSVSHSTFPLANGLICMAVPVAYTLIAGAFLLISVYGFGVSWPEIAADGGEPAWMWVGAVVFLIQAILSGALAYAASRHRGLSPKARFFWTVGGALGGFGVALAIIAIYQRCIREVCWQCKKMRRVDLQLCDHCGWEWETPVKDGTEVLDEARVETVAC